MESTSPLIDTDFGISQLSGNRDLYITLLGKFSDEYRDLNDKLQTAMRQGQYDEAFALVHTVKGVTANLGLTALHHASKQIEIAIRGKEALPEDYSGFVLILKRTLNAIEALGETSDAASTGTHTPSARAELVTTLEAREFIPETKLNEYIQELTISHWEQQALRNAVDELDYDKAIDILSRPS